MIPVGAVVNASGIALGGLVGLAFGSRLPERVRTIVFQAGVVRLWSYRMCISDCKCSTVLPTFAI